MNKKMEKQIIAGLMIGGLVFSFPSQEVLAAPMARPSVRVSTPRVRVSTPRVSTPKIKVSSPKPTIKSGSSTMKPSNTTKIPRVTSKPKNNSIKSNSKVVTRTPKAPSNYTRPSYINNYSSSSRYSSDLNFWRLYGITHMLTGNRNPSEKEIAEELAKKGYTESEIKKIMNEANKEQKEQSNKKSFINALGKFIGGTIIVSMVGLGIFFLYRRF